MARSADGLTTSGSMRRIGSLTAAARLRRRVAVAVPVGADQLVHAQQVIEVGVEVVEEDRVEEHAADLRQRRARDRGEAAVRLLAGVQLGARQRVRRALAADADGEDARRAEADGGAERRHQAQAAVAEVALADLRSGTSTGGKTIGIAAEARTWSRVSSTASDTRRLFSHSGWPARPWMKVYDLPEW